MKRPAFLNTATLIRVAVTGLAVIAAAYAGMQLWSHYEVEPWTRDGRIRANVVQVAPDVSGLVSSVRVADNAAVHAGDVLFEIDARRFELAHDQAKAALHAAEIAREQAAREVKRNKGLSDLIAAETREIATSRLDQAAAQVAQANVALAVAQLNLDRSRIVAPADGRITNLDLRSGAYVNAGHPVMALVEAGTFYVEGYFEETKLHAIHIGDPATVTPMGSDLSLHGHVQSIAYGITDRDRGTGANLLPNVNPTFNWVRLAQRVPVRVELDAVEPGVRLVAGQTTTVSIEPAAATATSAPMQKQAFAGALP